MARCTKEEALATRDRLLDAAELVFSEKGVSRTSLSDIAEAAGASRGAIYWHFKNKADLFNAMMDRTRLPLEDSLDQIGHDTGRDPLADLQCAIRDAMQKIATDERTRRVFEVATLKVEYVDELLAVKARHLQCYVEGVIRMQRNLQEAAKHRAQPLQVCPAMAAQGLHALVVGLIHTWLLAPASFELVGVADLAVATYLAGLGLLPIPVDAVPALAE
ncbi:MAG: TetR family transcriptional regulator [Pseudomonadota bacterium]